jgi:pimeloyl-ACP methyl ester carboxylesterase
MNPELRRLHVWEYGPRDAPSIVFLHGVGCTGQMWQDHFAALGDYHCIAPDLPGHGRSRAVEWTSLEDTAALVAGVIYDLPTRSAHVVGLSLGGAVAFELLATHADLLDHVVIDGCAAVGSPWAGVAKVAFAAISPFVRHAPVGRLMAAAVGVTDPTGVADMVHQMRQVDPRSFRGAFADAQEVRIVDGILRAACPTLLVSGGKELAAVHTSSRLLADRMPHAEAWVMPGSGHGWLGSHPDIHVRMVRAWIEGLRLPAELIPEPSRTATLGNGARADETTPRHR